MTPNAEDRAAIAREATLQLVNEFTDGTICDTFRLTPAQRARMLGYIDSEYATPAPALPPIPLGAVVEVEGDEDAPYVRDRDRWCASDGSVWPDGGRTERFVTALYHARRERDAWRDDAQRYAANADFWRDRAEAAERERDEATHRALDLSVALQVAEAERDDARRALAAKVASCSTKNCAGRELSLYDALERIRELEAAAKDQGLGATTPNSEGLTARDAATVQNATSPAPASAPLSETAPISCAGNTGEIGKARRWWLVVDRDDDVASGWQEKSEADEHAEGHRRNRAFGPYTVVPVIEARVTRETVDKLARLLRDDWAKHVAVSPWDNLSGLVQDCYRSNARAALTALGLTVEE